MISAGIDAGSAQTKVVIVEDSKILGKGLTKTGFDVKGAIEDAFTKALKEAELQREDVETIVITAISKKLFPDAQREVPKAAAAVKGAHFLIPTVKTVVDVGAEEVVVSKVDEKGKLVDFAVSDKCAAGTGAFIESMSIALDVPLDEFGKIALQAKGKAAINAQCVIFAESEVVSLLHENVPIPDISKAIHDAIADRIASIARRVGIEDDVVVVGGPAKDPGLLKSLEDELGTKVKVPNQIEPEFALALGCALMGGE